MPRPAAGLTCPTEECTAYLDEVSSLSKAVAVEYEVTAARVQNGEFSNWPTERKLKFETLYHSFLTAHRKPFIDTMALRKEKCFSTFPGPCQESIATTSTFEDQARKYAKALADLIGEDTSIIEGKEKQPSKGTSGSLLGEDTGSSILKLLAVGGIIYILVKK